MALDFWATIELSGVTLFVTTAASDVYRLYSLHPFNHWKPVLIVGNIVQEFASEDEPREIPATMQITLVNKDGWLDQYLGFGANAKMWDGRIVTLRYGGSEGSNFSTMALEFKGRIERGTLQHNRTSVTFTCQDIRAAHDRQIMTAVFDSATYPSLEDKTKGRYIPVVYGDYTGASLLPAFCVDIGTKRFKVCGHSITDLTVYRNGIVVSTGNYTTNLASGEFTFTTEPYTSGDVVTVACKGRNGTRGITGGTGTFQYAHDILYDLLVSFGGAVVGDIDTAAMLAAHTASDTYSNRRYIDAPLTVMEAIGQLAFENNLDFYVSGGLYTTAFWTPSSVVDQSISDKHIVEDECQSAYDPNRWYVNRIQAQFDVNHAGTTVGAENYHGVTMQEDALAQTEYGSVVAKGMVFEWLYVKSNVDLQLQRKLFVWASRAHIVKLVLRDRSGDAAGALWRIELRDVLSLTYWQYIGQPLWVRSITRNGQNGDVEISAMAVLDSFQLAQWANTQADPQVTYPCVWNNDALDYSPRGRWF